jgi:hypothetical protein
MLVISTAVNYSVEQVKPFILSLLDTGFDGNIAFVTNDCPAKAWLRQMGVTTVDQESQGFHLNSDRFFHYKEFVRGVDQCLVADCRDVVFQSNPEELPMQGINAYEEDRVQTLGSCGYNNSWITGLLGSNPYADKPILCAGTISGQLSEYLVILWEAIKASNPVIGFDQGIHNHFIYSGKFPATCHLNGCPIYTVGHTARESVTVKDGVVYYGDKIPCVVHQYDRHENLKRGIKWLA